MAKISADVSTFSAAAHLAAAGGVALRALASGVLAAGAAAIRAFAVGAAC